MNARTGPSVGGSAATAISLDEEDEIVVFRPAATPAPGPLSAAVPPAPADAQRLLVLCGVVGCGKSTLASAFERELPGYVRVCQDVLGSRQACETKVQEQLAAGLSVIVDRTNFNVEQREHWINIARRFVGIETCALVFTTPVPVCQQRLLLRTGHETLKDPEKAIEVLDKFVSQFRQPTSQEGFDRIIRLPPDLPPVPDRATLERILARLRSTPKQMRLTFGSSGFPSFPNSSRGRGTSRGGGRGSHTSSPYQRRGGSASTSSSWR